MKVATAASSPLPAGAGGAMRAVRPGEAARCGPGPGVSPGASPGAAEQAAAALLYDMKGCYSRLRALVPTLPRHRRVSKVELLQHVIDYIWDLQLALPGVLLAAVPPPAPVLPLRFPLALVQPPASGARAQQTSWEKEIASGVVQPPCPGLGVPPAAVLTGAVP
uniref:DNA-binding protein inhibitor ID-4 n=1 Tax=Strix occidentalis caurina TaxID=311401 RepID=A0A8D0FFA4_STROC